MTFYPFPSFDLVLQIVLSHVLSPWFGVLCIFRCSVFLASSLYLFVMFLIEVRFSVSLLLGSGEFLLS